MLTMNPYTPFAPYTLPFTPRHFFVAPVQWLRVVSQVSEFDALCLLASAHPPQEPGDLLLFPDDRPESFWTRGNSLRLPNLVSHVKYYAWIDSLAERGWLVNCTDLSSDDSLQTASLTPGDSPAGKLVHNGCYRMVHWPEMGGEGFVHAPRAFIEHRWPKLFDQNRTGVRSALAGCWGRLSLQVLESGARRAETITTQRQILQAASFLTPQLYDPQKTGQGVRNLVDLGLIDEVARSGRNRHYRVSADAFAHPPSWPPEEIARRCLLDSTTQQVWIDLVQAFLRFNYLPLGRCVQVWEEIREHEEGLVTEEDARRVLAELTAKAGHASTSPKRILGEYQERVKKREGRFWLETAQATLTLGEGFAHSPEELAVPTGPTESFPMALHLRVSFHPSPRLSVQRTCELVRHLALWLVQGDRAWRVAASLTVDPWAVRHRLTIPLPSSAHTELDFAQPMRFLLEWRDLAPPPADARLQIGIRLRAYYHRNKVRSF